MESEYKVHPFIEAVIEILEPIWDKQLCELRKKGMLPDKEIIYRRPDPRDLQRWEDQIHDWDYDPDCRK